MTRDQAALFTDIFTFQYASIKPFQPHLQHLPYRGFTFQYASIKPPRGHSCVNAVYNLHFNMLLLNLICSSPNRVQIINLHFNMLLLNR